MLCTGPAANDDLGVIEFTQQSTLKVKYILGTLKSGVVNLTLSSQHFIIRY